MIYHGIVHDIDDANPITGCEDKQARGRVRIQLIGFREDVAGMNITPWCHACMPFAGAGYGFFAVPQVGDEAIVAHLESGDWVVLGYHWSGRKGKPSQGSAEVLIFKTLAGHYISFTESRGISIKAVNGGIIEVKGNGTIDITATGNINLNGGGGGVVTTQHKCAYTGANHPFGSSSVKAET